MKDDERISELGAICSILQFAGVAFFLLALHFRWMCVPMGISGFAGIVKLFLPREYYRSRLGFFAAACGFLIIIASCLMLVHSA